MKIKDRMKKILRIDCNTKWYFTLKYKLGSLPFYFFRIFPIKKNKIVFSSFHGSKYGGDPKYISNMIHRKDGSLDLVWLLDNAEQCKDSYVRVVPYKSVKAIYELVTSKIWIDDCRKKGSVRKRKGQFYIGTGHGGIPMKKIEKDAIEKLGTGYLLLALNDSRMTDLKPSNSRWRNDMLRRAFWYDGEILNCGLPRVEYLLKNRQKMYTEVRNSLGISDDTQVYIYAPTFRKDGDLSNYNLDFKQVGKTLASRFGGKWIGLRRLHPNVTDYRPLNIPETVIDTTNYPDMEELLLASDLLITDYSSCIFESFFLNIPAFIYATDINEYIYEDRGLYWHMSELPFPKAATNDELIRKIESFDEVQYKYEVDRFKEQLGLFDDQIHATEILTDRILDEIKK